MKQIRFSPWLIVVLAVILVFAAGCNRPDPQVEIATPQPQQPLAPQTVGTPGASDIEATPTLPIAIGGPTDLGIAGTPGVMPTLAAVAETPGAIPTLAAVAGTPGAVPTVAAAAAATQAAPQPVATPQTQTNASGNTVYTVKPGDTLFSIGRMFNVNPYAVAAANNIPYPYIIYPGQQLIIPTGTTPPTTPPGSNPTPVPPPASGTCRFYHTVRPGENLFRISMAYGVPMATIAAANGIVNYNLIYAGQTLCIP